MRLRQSFSFPLRHTASSYLSSWCSGRPAAVGRAADEGEAVCSVQGESSAAPGDCCHSSRSRSYRGTRRLRGNFADPDPPHWMDSRWSRLSDGQYYEGPQGSPYWYRKSKVGRELRQQFPSDVIIAWNKLHKLPSLTLYRYFSSFCQVVLFVFLYFFCLFLFLSSLLSCSQSFQLWSVFVHTALLVNSVVCRGQRATSHDSRWDSDTLVHAHTLWVLLWDNSAL